MKITGRNIRDIAIYVEKNGRDEDTRLMAGIARENLESHQWESDAMTDVLIAINEDTNTLNGLFTELAMYWDAWTYGMAA